VPGQRGGTSGSELRGGGYAIRVDMASAQGSSQGRNCGAPAVPRRAPTARMGTWSAEDARTASFGARGPRLPGQQRGRTRRRGKRLRARPAASRQIDLLPAERDRLRAETPRFSSQASVLLAPDCCQASAGISSKRGRRGKACPAAQRSSRAP
jgi:hypothetical protein